MNKRVLKERFDSRIETTIEEGWGHRKVDEDFQDFVAKIVDLVPEGRQQSIMLTKLEEARFWANDGVTKNVR